LLWHFLQRHDRRWLKLFAQIPWLRDYGLSRKLRLISSILPPNASSEKPWGKGSSEERQNLLRDGLRAAQLIDRLGVTLLSARPDLERAVDDLDELIELEGLPSDTVSRLLARLQQST
jgi:hypothetical protein